MDFPYFAVLLAATLGSICLSWRNRVCLHRIEHNMELEKRVEYIERDLVKKESVQPIHREHKIPEGKPWRYMPDGVTKYQVDDQYDEKYKQKVK